MIRDQIKLIRFNCDIRFLTQPSAQCAKKFPPSNMELRHPFRPDASLSISAFLIVHDNALHSSYPRHVLVSTNNGPSTHGDSSGPDTDQTRHQSCDNNHITGPV